MSFACDRGLRVRCLFVLLCVSALIAGAIPASAIAADKAAGWEVKPDPPANPVKWPDKLSLDIAQSDRADELLFPSNLSEYVLAGLKHYESDGGELWNLTTGKRVASMKGSPVKAHKRALSPDGQYLAIAALGGDIPGLVEVWSLSSGKKTASIQADEAKMSMTILDFAGPGELLTYTFGNPSGKFVHHLRIWDVQTGKSLRQFDLTQNLSGDDHYQITPGRRYLASLMSRQVEFFDLTNGSKAGALTPPSKTEAGENVSPESFRFSPDGSEVAVLSDSFNASVIRTFDMATGDAKLTHDLPSFKFGLQHASSYKGPSLDYATDASAFLLFGSALVDHESGLVLWTYQSPPADYNHWQRILTPNGLISSVGPKRACKVQVVKYPAEAMRKSLAALQKDVPAYVKPGDKVAVAVTVGKLQHSDPEKTRADIIKAITERLSNDGIEVADDGTSVIALDYQEGKGKTLQEVQGGKGPIGGTATGKSVTATAATLAIKWTTRDGKTKIWESQLALDPSFISIREGEATDAKARDQMFAMLQRQVANQPFPYFVPEDKSLSPLPILSGADEDKPGSKGKTAVQKKIDAKKKKLGK